MISKTLSTSRKFAKLASEFGQVLYVLIVPHCDDFGRQSGDAFTIKHQVFPTSPRTEEEFEAALVDMEGVTLIDRYDVAGEKILQVVSFEQHQVGLHKRSASRFPENPGTSGKFPEIPSELKGTELNRTEVNGTAPRTQGIGAATPGSLPRDHMFHVICGPRYRLCLSQTVYGGFARRYGGDEGTARAALVGWVEALEREIGDGAIGDHLWLTKHFDAFLASVGRAPVAPPRPVEVKKPFSVQDALDRDAARKAARS